MKKRFYAILFVVLILTVSTACGKKFSESDYDFGNNGIIYDYSAIPKNHWNALYPKEPDTFEKDYFEMKYDEQMSNFEHFAHCLIGFAGETYVDKHNLDVSDLDYRNYQEDYSFNTFRDTTTDVCVEVHPGDWTFSGHGNETYPIVYFFDTNFEAYPVDIERIEDAMDKDYFKPTLQQLEYVDTYNNWQVYIRPNTNPENIPFEVKLFQQLGKDAVFMMTVDIPYISDDKNLDLNDFYERLSKLVTLSTEDDYEDIPFSMPSFEENEGTQGDESESTVSDKPQIDDPDEYYYQMALAVKEQVFNYFEAMKSGDTNYMIEHSCYSENSEDIFEDFKRFSESEYSTEIMQILYGDMVYDATDEMMQNWAGGFKQMLYQNQSEADVTIPMIYAFPDLQNWKYGILKAAEEGEYTAPDISNLSMDVAISEMREAKKYLMYNASDAYLSIHIQEDSYDVKIDLPRVIRFVPLYVIEDASVDSPQTYATDLLRELGMIAMRETDGAEELEFDIPIEDFALVEDLLIKKDFVKLEEYILNSGNETEVGTVAFYQERCGKYDDLNEEQKLFVDEFIDKYMQFEIVNFKGSSYTSYEKGAVRQANMCMKYPCLREVDVDSGIYYPVEKSIENQINTVHSCSILWGEELYASTFLGDYYEVIRYARDNM